MSDEIEDVAPFLSEPVQLHPAPAAPVAIILQTASPQRLVYLIEGNGKSVSAEISNERLQADAKAGPLLGALRASYVNQDAARAIFGRGKVSMIFAPRTLGGCYAADVDLADKKVKVVLCIPPSLATSYFSLDFFIR